MGTEKNLVEEVRLFALGVHRRINQRRKYSFQPYEVHLKAVTNIVSQITEDSNMISAVWLHDVVEDTLLLFQFDIAGYSVHKMFWHKAQCADNGYSIGKC